MCSKQAKHLLRCWVSLSYAPLAAPCCSFMCGACAEAFLLFTHPTLIIAIRKELPHGSAIAP